MASRVDWHQENICIRNAPHRGKCVADIYLMHIASSQQNRTRKDAEVIWIGRIITKPEKTANMKNSFGGSEYCIPTRGTLDSNYWILIDLLNAFNVFMRTTAMFGKSMFLLRAATIVSRHIHTSGASQDRLHAWLKK